MRQITRVNPSRRFKILERRKKIAALYKQKYTQKEIGEMLNISRRTVINDMNAIRDEWREDRVDDLNEVYMLDLVSLNRMERLIWKRLQQLEKDPRAGTRWMEMLLRLYDRRAKMIGYDAADKRDPGGGLTINVINKEQADAALAAFLKANQLVEDMAGNVPMLPGESEGSKVIDINQMTKTGTDA